MFRKTISVLLAVVLCIGCFSMVSFAASDDVKLIRRLNSNFSMSECYNQGVWKAYALADKNGNPIYYENNPINENGVYRAVEKNVDNKGVWYADMSGRGTTDKKNGIGESFDSDYPFSWNYSQLHVALKYTGRFYYENGATYSNSSLNSLVSLGEAYEVIFMDHHLVFPMEFFGSNVPLYKVEEVCSDSISLYYGDVADIYLEDADGNAITSFTASTDDTPIATCSNGKLYAEGAGETTLKVKFTKNNRTIEKSFRVIVKGNTGNANTGFRCSRCDWYDEMTAKGGFSAMIAKVVHPIFHAFEQMFKRF